LSRTTRREIRMLLLQLCELAKGSDMRYRF
jgi:hypothetical protein